MIISISWRLVQTVDGYLLVKNLRANISSIQRMWCGFEGISNTSLTTIKDSLFLKCKYFNKLNWKCHAYVLDIDYELVILWLEYLNIINPIWIIYFLKYMKHNKEYYSLRYFYLLVIFFVYARYSKMVQRN